MNPALAANSSSDDPPKAPRLPRHKGDELLGLIFLALGVVLLACFVSYNPLDESVLHRPANPQPVTNWVGEVGAEVSALGFGLLGLTILFLPVVCAGFGWRRLRRGEEPDERVVGRGLGLLLLLASVPPLLRLSLAAVPWRGSAVEAGGAYGRLLGDFLASRLNVSGAFLVLFGALAVALALTVRSTLLDTLSAAGKRIGSLLERNRLTRERKQERRHKEGARRRVVARHVERVREQRRTGGAGGSDRETGEFEFDSGGSGEVVSFAARPARVIARRGTKHFRLRRVSNPTPEQLDASAPWTEAPLSAAPAEVGTSGRDGGPRSRAAAVPVRDRPVAASVRGAAPTPKPKPEPPSSGKTGKAAKVADNQQEFSFAEDLRSQGPGLPPMSLLQQGDYRANVNETELVRLGEVIRARLSEFGVEGTIDGISPGPVITVFEFQPAPGVKVSQIVNLQDDLALALKAHSVRIDRMAGRSTLGIEVPNNERQVIRLGSLLINDAFERARSPLTMALGVTMHGEPYYADLATMPHLLVAGATGAGKSVGLQGMITSILYKASKEDVRFIFIDPKRIELGVYADIPNLATRVVVEPQQAANVLNNMVTEMEHRYKLLAEVHVRSIAFYNQAILDPEQRKKLAVDEDGGEFSPDDFQPMPYYVIIIDELADLMMVASSEVETAIARLAQMARAVGIHLIVATQRPSVDVLTGTIKANFPCRLAYATATRHDSRTILDRIGAEQLLGKGDALFMPPGTSRFIRLHGSYVSEQETAGLVRWLKKAGKPDYNLGLLENTKSSRSGASGDSDNDDELFDEAARLVVAEGQASASFLQRRMRVGFSRAARLIDMMERDGLLGPPQGSKPREVLVPVSYFEEIDRARREP